MQNILQDLSSNRNAKQAENDFVYSLASNEGLENLHSLLNSNNRLAYVFFPPALNRIIKFENPQNFQNVLSAAPSFLKYISLCNDQNNRSLCIAIAHYANNSLIDRIFYQKLKEMIVLSTHNVNIQERIICVLFACSEKFMKLSRSDNLFSEINFFVDLFGKFIVHCIVTGIADENSLRVYESLISHDMPTLFEDNSKVISETLFKNLGNSNERMVSRTCNILKQYFMKYGELFDIVDFSLHFFKKSRTAILPEEGELLYLFVKQKHVFLIDRNIDSLINIFIKMCEIEFDEDSVTYTMHAHKIETDPYRGKVAEMILIVDSLVKVDYLKYFNNYLEPILFYCTVLGHKMAYYLFSAIRARRLDDYSLYTVLRYHLIYQVPFINIDFLTDRLYYKDYSFFQIIRYFCYIIEQVQRGIDKEIWNEEIVSKVLNNVIVLILIDYNKENADMFRSKYFFLAMQNKLENPSFSVSKSLIKYIYNMIYDVEKLTIYESYLPLFDSLTILIKESDFSKRGFIIAQRIIEKDRRELFPFMFQIYAMLINKGFFDQCMVEIFSDGALWREKSNVLSLTILTISLYRAGKIETPILQNLCEFIIEIDPRSAYILMRFIVLSDENTYFTFIMQIAHKHVLYDEIFVIISKLSLTHDMFLVALDGCLTELLKTTVNAQCVDQVKEGCIKIMKHCPEPFKNKAEEVLRRNATRFGNINLLSTVVNEFISMKTN